MLEDYEESISLTLRTRSSKKPLGMLERNWKHQWLQRFAIHARKTSMGRPVARLMTSSQNLRVSWKPVNPQECGWKNQNAKRFRRRKGPSKIEADDEFGLALQRKESWRACLDRIRKPGENQIWKSERTSELVECAATKNRVTCVMGAGSSNYTEWNVDEKWSSQVCGNLMKCWEPADDKYVIDDDMDSDTATESNLSLKSRSLLDRVNGRLRKTLDHSSKDAMQDIDKRSLIWDFLMSSTLEASVFMRKNYSNNLHSVKKYRGKSHFDTDVWHIWKLIVGQSDEIYGVILHGNNYLWSVMKKSSVSRMQRLRHSQIPRYVLERWIRTQHPMLFGNDSWIGSKIHHKTELWTQLMVSQWNSSGIFHQDSPHCSSSTKSKSSQTKLATQHNSKDELSSCRCSMTSYGELKTMKRNALLTPHLCLYLQKHVHQDVGHSSDLDQKTSGIPPMSTNHKENGTESQNWWWYNLVKADTQFSVPRVHWPEERSKAKEVGNYRYTSAPMVIRLKLFFAQLFLLISSVSTEQSQICVRNTVLVK